MTTVIVRYATTDGPHGEEPYIYAGDTPAEALMSLRRNFRHDVAESYSDLTSETVSVLGDFDRAGTINAMQDWFAANYTSYALMSYTL